MKKYYMLWLLSILSVATTFAQRKAENQQLAVLAKTWGHLKYYHPEIASGKYNWDSVLIVAIQNILHANKKNQVTAELERMFELAGENTATEYHPENLSPMAHKNYDISWVEKNRWLSARQKQRLIYNAKHPYNGINFYAQSNRDNDSTVYTPNEKPYQEMLHPEVEYRLLALFRFWNVIEYFYPYKYAIGKPWDRVLSQLIPVMVGATDTLSYHKAIAEMSASINDSHGSLWPSVFDSFTGKYSPPFDFVLLNGKAVVIKIPALTRATHIQVGSVITSIQNVTIQQRIKENWNYVSASNPGGKLKTMHSFILNTPQPMAIYAGKNPDGSRFIDTIIQVQRNFIKEYVTFMKMTSPVVAKVMDRNVGYIYFSNISARNVDSAMNAVCKTRALIFDMRNYPTDGAGTYYVPNYLLSEPKIYAKNTYPNFKLPGLFNYKLANNDTDFSTVGKNNPNPYLGKIILLVDSRTQSAAEWACMTLMTANKVTVIGSQTAGADGNVTRTILPGNYKINFSGLGIYFPDGTETQRKGIPIDIKVGYTIEDLINNHDPILARAIRFATEK